jgi:ribose 5-phosphate isomerase B
MERKNQIDFIKAEINDKVSYARTRCIELMCSDDVYGVSEIGDINVLEKMTNEQLYAYYQTLLTSAEIEIFYVGGDEAENLVGQLKTAFSSVERLQVVKPPETKIAVPPETSKEFVENMAVSQGKLSLAFVTGIVRKDDNYPALVLFNAIFGMTPSSKLFVNVREKLSLCYYCRSDVVSNKGILLVSCGIEVENKEKSQSEIIRQLEAVKNGECDRGIIVCGTGIGISISANKVPGIRAALCTDSYTARMSREHNDANILALGGRVVGTDLALEIVDTWLNTEFSGGRHGARVNKISEIEKKYCRDTQL